MARKLQYKLSELSEGKKSGTRGAVSSLVETLSIVTPVLSRSSDLRVEKTISFISQV